VPTPLATLRLTRSGSCVYSPGAEGTRVRVHLPYSVASKVETMAATNRKIVIYDDEDGDAPGKNMDASEEGEDELELAA